jgi:lauroyl/myristoyl acyltransferase
LDAEKPSSIGPGTTATWTTHALNSGLVFGATCWGVRHLPGQVSYAIGDAGTWLAHRLMRGTTSALADNFQGAFPSLTRTSARALALRAYRSYARDVIGFLRCVDLTGAAAVDQFDWPASQHDVFYSHLRLGRGLILVTGHFGSWEIGSVLLRALNLPLTIVAMREASAEINRLRVDLRARLGAETLEVRRSLDTALQLRRRLASNGIVAMLMDRHVGRDRVEVRFFGRRTFFLRTPALLAYLTGAPLLPCAIVRLPDGRYLVEPGQAIHVSRDLDRDHAAALAAQAFAADLEERIRERPECWYQFYPYWQAQEEAVRLSEPAA